MSAPRLTLILPAVSDTAAFAPRLSALLAAGSIAAVVLKPGPDEKATLAVAKALAPIIQAAGAAALLDSPSDARLVARAGADGAQYPAAFPGLREAISELKPARIVGVCGLKARHDAMEAGEADIDYVLFGEARADGSLPDTDRTEERVGWWAEIFTLPCVGYAANLEAVARLARAGADFVALGPWLFDAADPGRTLGEAAHSVAANTPS